MQDINVLKLDCSLALKNLAFALKVNEELVHMNARLYKALQKLERLTGECPVCKQTIHSSDCWLGILLQRP